MKVTHSAFITNQNRKTSKICEFDVCKCVPPGIDIYVSIFLFKAKLHFLLHCGFIGEKFGRVKEIMYRNRLEKSGFYQPRSNRSNAQASRVKNDEVKLVPELYSDGICLYTLGPTQVYSYYYSFRTTSTKTYVSEIFFYPKVVKKKHISVVVHYPARNNARPYTLYKDVVCLVPRCLENYQSKKIIKEPKLVAIFKTGVYQRPKKQIREYSSSVHLVPKSIDTVR